MGRGGMVAARCRVAALAVTAKARRLASLTHRRTDGSGTGHVRSLRIDGRRGPQARSSLTG